MKKTMALFGFIIALILTLGMGSLPSVSSVSAQGVIDNGYTIENYHVSVVVDETNTYTITEDIQVSFGNKSTYGESHGIYRYIPDQLTIARDVNGKWKDYFYQVNINLLEAKVVESGTNYEEAFYENGNLVILIRENQLVNDEIRSYKIVYEYEIGYDRVEEYDEFYLNLLGDQWNTKIKNFSFSITMPKPFNNSPVFYTGVYGTSEPNENVTYQKNGNVITGLYGQTIAPFNAFTVRLELPNDYYSQVQKFSVAWDVVILIVTISVMVGLVMWYVLKRKHKPVVVTVEFYPPNNMDPVHTIYALNGYATPKNLTSLIIYFASNGYLNILESDNKELSLQKLKDLPRKAPSYQKTVFDALFKDVKQTNEVWEPVLLKSLEKSIGNNFLQASTTVATECGGRYDQKSVWQTIGMLALSTVPFVTFMLLYGIRVNTLLNFPLAGVLLFAISLFCSFMVHNVIQANLGKVRTNLFVILSLAMFGLGAFLVFQSYWETLVDPLMLKLFTLAPLWFGSFFAPKMKHYNDEYTQIIGKTLGFRKNIVLVEKKRMEMLLKDDPSYFYHILPYAYVFNITKEFSEKFEGLAMEQPSWYISSQPMPVFHAIMFSNMLSTQLGTFSTHIASRAGGSGFGGMSSGGGFGGGFSGGGFGGGGGGRA